MDKETYERTNVIHITKINLPRCELLNMAFVSNKVHLPFYNF